MAYTLRPEARWHDGQPVTVEDVIWSLGNPEVAGTPRLPALFRQRRRRRKDRPAKRTFRLQRTDQPRIAAHRRGIAHSAQALLADRDFQATTLEPPLGSGPYRVKAVDPGRSITYELDPNYWGKDLPVNLGKNNYGIMHYEYYKDRGVQREAFKAGKIDFFSENVAKEWATGVRPADDP